MGRLFVLLAAPLLLFGAGVEGRWIGTIEVHSGGGDAVRTPVQLQLARHSAELSGEIGREGENEHVSIEHGRVGGSIVYFEASGEHTKGPMTFRLTVTGDRMEGDMTGETDQGRITGVVRFTREGH